MSTMGFQMVVERVKTVWPSVVNAAAKIAKAAAAGAVVAGLTALANVTPELSDKFGLNAVATGQIVAIVVLARDALKARVEK